LWSALVDRRGHLFRLLSAFRTRESSLDGSPPCSFEIGWIRDCPGSARLTMRVRWRRTESGTDEVARIRRPSLVGAQEVPQRCCVEVFHHWSGALGAAPPGTARTVHMRRVRNGVAQSVFSVRSIRPLCPCVPPRSASQTGPMPSEMSFDRRRGYILGA
jgi:hypothetical protein